MKSKFLTTSVFKWINPKEFEMNKHTSNSCKQQKIANVTGKDCALEIDLEYPKELHELHNYYPFGQDNIEIKTEMLPNYELKVDDLYNIHIGDVKNCVLEVSRGQWLKPYVEFNTGKMMYAKKNDEKDGNAFYKSTDNDKTMENLELI